MRPKKPARGGKHERYANGLYVISSKIGATDLEDLEEAIIVLDDINDYKDQIKNILKKKIINKKGLKLIKEYDFEKQKRTTI